MDNLIHEFKGFIFNLQVRRLRKAQKELIKIAEEKDFDGLESNEELMFMLCTSGQSKDSYNDMLDTLTDDEYAMLVNLPTSRIKSVGKSMAVYMKPQSEQAE